MDAGGSPTTLCKYCSHPAPHFPEGKLYTCSCPFIHIPRWAPSISFLDLSHLILSYLLKKSPEPLSQPILSWLELVTHCSFTRTLFYLFASSIIKMHFLHGLSTSGTGAVIGAFSTQQPLPRVSTAVSIFIRKQAETWGTCLMPHSVEKLGFGPRFVYSIWYIPYFQKELGS